jgi:hypothetical protein
VQNFEKGEQLTGYVKSEATAETTSEIITAADTDD